MDEFFGIVILIVLGVGGAIWLEAASCSSKTEGIGMPHKWGPLSGCLVKDKKDGAWVPLENYRNIN